MRGELSPKLQPFVNAVNIAITEAKAAGVVPTPELARARLADLNQYNTQPPTVAWITDRTIKSPFGDVACRVYQAAHDIPLPVFVYFHGGGHMCGSVDVYDPICRRLANAVEAVVVSVDYPLAPECPFPGALDVAEWVLLNYRKVVHDFPINDQIFIGGDSAGGAICASLVARMAGNAALKIDKQVLFYPSVDYTMQQASIEENGQGYFLEKARIAWYFDHYFATPIERSEVSPLFMPLPHLIPETMVVIAGCDPLRDECEAYAQRLRREGGKVTMAHYPNMLHAFLNLHDLVPEECQQLYLQVKNFLK